MKVYVSKAGPPVSEYEFNDPYVDAVYKHVYEGGLLENGAEAVYHVDTEMWGVRYFRARRDEWGVVHVVEGPGRG